MFPLYFVCALKKSCLFPLSLSPSSSSSSSSCSSFSSFSSTIVIFFYVYFLDARECNMKNDRSAACSVSVATERQACEGVAFAVASQSALSAAVCRQDLSFIYLVSFFWQKSVLFCFDGERTQSLTLTLVATDSGPNLALIWPRYGPDMAWQSLTRSNLGLISTRACSNQGSTLGGTLPRLLQAVDQ